MQGGLPHVTKPPGARYESLGGEVQCDLICRTYLASRRNDFGGEGKHDASPGPMADSADLQTWSPGDIGHSVGLGDDLVDLLALGGSQWTAVLSGRNDMLHLLPRSLNHV